MTCDVRGICNAQVTKPGWDEMKKPILRGTGGGFHEERVTSIFKKLFVCFFLHDFYNCIILIISIWTFCQFFCGAKTIDVCRVSCAT